MKRGRALPFHVAGALAILRAWHRTQPLELRARVEPWLDHLERMYRESRGERAAGELRAYAPIELELGDRRQRPKASSSTRKRR